MYGECVMSCDCHVYSTGIQVYMNVQSNCVGMYVCVCMYVCMYVHVCVCICVCVCVCVCVTIIIKYNYNLIKIRPYIYSLSPNKMSPFYRIGIKLNSVTQFIALPFVTLSKYTHAMMMSSQLIKIKN